MASVKNRIILLFAFWQLLPILPVDSAPTSMTPTTTYLPDYVTDGSTLARIFNGIALGQSLSDGTADMDVIVAELLNLGPDMNMKTLVDQDVPGLATALGGIASAVETACGVNGKCVDQKAVDEGVAALSVINMTVFENAKKALGDGSQLHKTLQLKQAYEKLQQQSVTQLASALSEDWTGLEEADAREKVGGIKTSLKFVSGQYLNDTLNLCEVVKQDDVLAEVKSILLLKSLADVTSDTNTKLKAFKDEVSVVQTKATSLSTTLSKDVMDKLDARLQVLETLTTYTGLTYQKKYTAGFFDGVKDLDLLSNDVKSPIFKKVFSVGESVKMIKTLLNSTGSLHKTLQPLGTSWKSMQFADGLVQKIQLLRDDLKKTQTEVTAGFAVYNKLQQCTATMNPGTTFDFRSLGNAEGDLHSLGAGITSTSSAFKPHKTMFADLEELRKMAKDTGTGIEILNKIKTWSKLQTFKDSLGNFTTAIDGEKSSKLSKAIKNIETDLFTDDFKSWATGSEYHQAKTCISQTNGATTGSSITVLASLTSTNTALTSTQTAATALKTPLDEWKRIESSMKSNRKTRDAKNPPKLKNAMKVSREFADGIGVVRGVAAGLSATASIQKLSDDEATIDAEIGRITDQKRKDEIGKVWNSETKTTLKTLPGKLKEMSNLAKKKPENLTDFESLFKGSQTIGVGDVDFQKLNLFFASFTAPSDIRDILEPLKHVSLHNFPPIMINSVLSIKEINDYLRRLFDPTNNRTSASKNAQKTVSNSNGEADQSSYLLYCWVGGGAVLFLVISGVLVGVVIWKKRKHEKKPPSDGESGNTAKVKPPNNIESIEGTKSGEKPIPKEGSKVEDGPPKSTKAQENKPEEAGNTASRQPNRVKNTVIGREDLELSGSEEKGILLNVSQKQSAPPKKNATTGKAAQPGKQPAKTKESPQVILFKDYVVEDRNRAGALAGGYESFKPVPFKDQPLDKPKDMKLPPKIKQDSKLEIRSAGDPMVFDINIDEKPKEPAPKTDKTVDASNASRKMMKTQETVTEDATTPLNTAVSSESVTKVNQRLVGAGEGPESFNNEGDDSDFSMLLNVDLAAVEENDWLYEMHKFEEGAALERAKFHPMDHPMVLGLKACLTIWNQHNPASCYYNPNASTKRLEAGLDDKGAKFRDYFVRRITLIDKRPELPDHQHPGTCSVEMSKYVNLEDCTYDKRGMLQVLTSSGFVHQMQAQTDGRRRTSPIPASIMLKVLVDTYNVVRKFDPEAIKYIYGVWRLYGDLHGEYMDFARSLLTGETNEFFYLREQTICIGDFVDRGANSCALLLLLCLLKLTYPDKFVLLRGNHEFMFINSVYGLLREFREIYGYATGDLLWAEANKLFAELPVAAVLNGKGWIAHGGFSEHMLAGKHILNKVKKVPMNKFEKEVHHDIVWSDPVHLRVIKHGTSWPAFSDSPRGGRSHCFNEAAVDKFFEIHGFTVIFRGHQPQKFGIGFCFNFKVVIVFSATNQRDGLAISNNWGVYGLTDAITVFLFFRFINLITEAVNGSFRQEPPTEEPT